MAGVNEANLNQALDALPHLFRGPGGVAGVVKDGQVIATRAWGFADVKTQHPMTAETRLPICSISKQFTCGVLLDKLGDPDAFNGRVAEFLPNFTEPVPTVNELCHNQSGLRDYWALSVLHGAYAEQVFDRDEALPVFARMKTGHFAPGTRYSYCNGNFRLLSEIIESEAGQTMDALYREVIWGPAGMKTAVLNSDTRYPADGVVGYEGNQQAGYFPADNGIYWVGDAGIAASLTDMLAYEQWIDTTRDDPDGLYRRMSAPTTFRDGAVAGYGYGLAHMEMAGVQITGHGGALRGFRSFRLHAADERLSIVVMFNHEPDLGGAVNTLLRAALGVEAPEPAAVADGWDGQWLCPETGLLARVETQPTGATLRFATGPDALTATPDGGLQGGGVSLKRGADGVEMCRKEDNLTTTLVPLDVVTQADGQDLSGRYESAELGAAMVIEARDGGVYGGFDGLLGVGSMEAIHPVGPDTWIVVTRRSLDAPAPGDWTLRVTRDDAGQVTGFVLGCWLARQIAYSKVS